MPTSSNASRRAASCGDSSGSTAPPMSPHGPSTLFLTSSNLHSSSQGRTLAPGMRMSSDPTAARIRAKYGDMPIAESYKESGFCYFSLTRARRRDTRPRSSRTTAPIVIDVTSDEGRTDSGILVQPFYDETDLDGFDADAQLGHPGDYPYTRGVQPTMYRGRLWTMRQYAGFGTAEDTNRRFRYLLEQGPTGLSVAFGLPTQMGYDSDASQAEGEVGRVGVPISSLADMEVLLDGLSLGTVSTSMTINASAAVLLAMYVAAAEKQGVSRAQVSGTTQNDILK